MFTVLTVEEMVALSTGVCLSCRPSRRSATRINDSTVVYDSKPRRVLCPRPIISGYAEENRTEMVRDGRSRSLELVADAPVITYEVPD